MIALKPCRFCGETHRLGFLKGGASDQYLFDAKLQIVRTDSGEPLDFEDDNVWCEVCDAMAPLQVWNAGAQVNAIMRTVTLAAWEEYDDHAVWQGQKAVAA